MRSGVGVTYLVARESCAGRSLRAWEGWLEGGWIMDEWEANDHVVGWHRGCIMTTVCW